MIFRVLSGAVMPAAAFGQGVLSDDLFGSFFAVALLIVSIMVTASFLGLYERESKPCCVLLAHITFKHRYGTNWLFY